MAEPVERILLLVHHEPNRRLLHNLLAESYEVVTARKTEELQQAFDLAIADLPSLHALGAEAVAARKRLDAPVFLPFLLLAQPTGGAGRQQLWQVVDESLSIPVSKAELQTRVSVLLRQRQLSLQLELRNRDLEAFARGLTHEVRAPLRAIRGFAQLLAQDQANRLTDEGRRDLTRILSAIDEMEELVEGLLDYLRHGRGAVQLETMPLALLIEGCLHQLADVISARGAQVTVEGATPNVRVDPRFFRLALTNLLSNAIKFVAPGVEPRVTVAARVEGGWCRIEVRDNGIGIPAEQLGHIFEPFTRLHGVEAYPGVGLGLATAYKAIRWMGGRLGCTSSPGQGSTFWLEVEHAAEGTGE